MWSFVLITALCCIGMLHSVLEQFAASAGSAYVAVSVVRVQPGCKPLR
ncbi:hypothetical protein [Pseudomonas sp. BN102]|nr:hypothetical protein [Pseudomonas sp. BN102]